MYRGFCYTTEYIVKKIKELNKKNGKVIMFKNNREYLENELKWFWKKLYLFHPELNEINDISIIENLINEKDFQHKQQGFKIGSSIENIERVEKKKIIINAKTVAELKKEIKNMSDDTLIVAYTLN